MQEAGVDISMHSSKRMEDVPEPIDLVVTVCDAARESCPVAVGLPSIHARFDDPPHLARGARTDDEAMPHYRRVRDEIRAFIESMPSDGSRAAMMEWAGRALTVVERRS